jgi:hypothetical protein
MSDPTTTPTPTNEQQDARMVIDYETAWDAVEASINLNADEKVEVQTLLRTHAYPLAAVSAATPDERDVATVARAVLATPADWPGPDREQEWAEHIARAALAARPAPVASEETR